MQGNQVLELIRDRRSVRHYSERPVGDDEVLAVLEAGRWAPSGMNNQPWRFVVVRDSGVKEQIAELSHYSRVFREAPVLIPVFIHKPSMYNEVKDHQSVGACLQNMLLAAHGLGLGAVWLGEILKNADQVRQVLGLTEDHELMAVVALGWPDEKKSDGRRKDMSELLIGGMPPTSA
jgi:nitroreductase